MSNTFECESESEIVKLLQITDPHLFKDTSKELLGINTHESFSQVLKEIQAESFDYDVVLATGDLVQDSSDEGYLRFIEMVKPLNKSVFWLPGNHDFQPKMVEHLSQPPINASKHLLLGKHWQVILLDSQVSGVPHGELSAYQLDWLKTHEFSEVLAQFNNVKGILYGHIHQEVDGYWQGYQTMATPATCIQFKPDSNHFALDTLQPGWREIELYPDGRIETRVKRIKQKTFLPNMEEEGY